MTRIAIIGAGFGGLAAAIELKRAGFDDLVIFERGEDVGGVWRENTYPGAACDIPSPYYSFSYAPNPGWSRRFAPQPDILGYLRHLTTAYDIGRHIRFGAAVASADFDRATGTWTIATSNGDTVEVDILIPAVGQLSRPALPDIEGRDSFAGPAFHSARWDHSVDLRGKRVAVIGTGASAIQLVPQIQPHVSRLTVFQRSAPYLLPRLDTRFSRLRRGLFAKVPLTQTAERGAWFALTEGLTVAILYARPLKRVVEAVSRWHMTRQLRDTDLGERLSPDYPFGCKRVLFSNDYLPAVAAPNVDLVTIGIEAITPTGVRTADGAEHQVDVIVYGTGFTATDFLAPITVHGADGRDLRAQWREGARAYLGVSVPHFPNLFLMYGPNTNLGSGSIVFMLECQARYIAQAVRMSAGRPLAVRPEVEQEYDDELQGRLRDGVWSKCSNWYRVASGRVVNNWPGTVSEYRRRTRHFRRDEYEPVG